MTQGTGAHAATIARPVRVARETEASESLVQELTDDVREAVRQEGLDPQVDTSAVRRLAERAIDRHNDRSLTGVVAPVPDAAGVAAEIVARVAGFGPLQRLLDDPEVEEVWINEPSRVFCARQGRHELTDILLDRDQVRDLGEICGIVLERLSAESALPDSSQPSRSRTARDAKTIAAPSGAPGPG